MPPPANSTEFLDLVQKSGVADDARLKAHLQRLTDQNAVPPEANKLAGLLLRDGYLTHFQAEQLLQGKWKRFFIGKYKVLERIGSGGMGQVFLCEHKLMRRRVAVKVLPAAQASNPSSLERFYREARAVAALDHPNIVRAYDIDQDDNLHFLVMEFVDGTNLQDLVKKFSMLDPLRACHYIYGSAVGLQHAHEMGLVHRDIKPGNILVDRSGVVKILDMGLARFFNDDDDLLTRKYDENILGTADYLAPEQAIDSHTVDIRADIYSLGATFYFLLTGQPPFPEGTVAQKLLWHQTREPVSVRTLRPEIPEELTALVNRMMSKDVSKRFQNPSEIMASLASWVQSPIAPPAERELPHLSIAAQGPGAGPGQSRIVTGAPTLIVGPQSGNPGPSPSDRLAVPTHVGSRSDVLRTTPRPTAAPVVTYPTPEPTPARVVAVSPQLAPAEDANTNPAALWDAVTSETRADAKSDTSSPKPAKVPKKTKPLATPDKKRSQSILIIAAIAVFGFVLFTGVGVAAYVLIFAKPKSNTPLPGQGQTWYVSKSSSPDAKHTVPTLRNALEQAGPEDAVIILEDNLDEPPISVQDNKGVKKGVRIEAGNAAKSVTWTPKVVSGRQISAALVIENIENFKVSGLVIELSGSIDSGISVSGNCHGLTIENVIVKNPKIHGFRVRATGDSARPIRVMKSRVKAESKIDSAVYLVAQNRFVSIQSCRLEGPGLAGCRVDGVAQDCEFRNNRVYGFDYGVSLVGRVTDETPYTLTIASNTFHTLAIAGLGSDFSFKGAKQKLDLTNNYFVGTPAIVRGPANGIPILKASDNARDVGSQEDKPSSNSVEIPNYSLPVNSASDGEFLFPAANSPLHAVGANKVAVGARPE